MSNWGYLEFSLDNLNEILKAIFFNLDIYKLSLLSLSLGIAANLFYFRKKEPVLLFLLLTLFFEIMLVRYFSPFHIRFFGHWSLFVPFILVSPIMFGFRYLKISVISLLIIVLINHGLVPIKESYQLNIIDQKINEDDWWFATGKHDIHSWLKSRWSKPYPVVEWCDDRNVMTKIYSTDIDFVTLTSGLARIFFTGCDYEYVSLDYSISVLDSVKLFLFSNLGQYYVSTTKCGEEIYSPYKGYEKAEYDYLFDQNIVCNQEKISDYVYQLKLKASQ